jgi:hypothetical protein
MLQFYCKSIAWLLQLKLMRLVQSPRGQRHCKRRPSEEKGQGELGRRHGGTIGSQNFPLKIRRRLAQRRGGCGAATIHPPAKVAERFGRECPKALCRPKRAVAQELVGRKRDRQIGSPAARNVPLITTTVFVSRANSATGEYSPVRLRDFAEPSARYSLNSFESLPFRTRR